MNVKKITRINFSGLFGKKNFFLLEGIMKLKYYLYNACINLHNTSNSVNKITIMVILWILC